MLDSVTATVVFNEALCMSICGGVKSVVELPAVGVAPLLGCLVGLLSLWSNG